MPDERSEASVDREGRVVSAAIGAADLVALRAGTNTWLRLVGVAEDVAAAGDQRRR
jgi:KEOPS complex subunit Pcc1